MPLRPPHAKCFRHAPAAHHARHPVPRATITLQRSDAYHSCEQSVVVVLTPRLPPLADMLRVLVALLALLAASSSAAFINEDFGRGPAFEHLRKDLRSASSISTRGAGSAEVVGLASQLNRQARDEHRDEHHGVVVNVEYREKPLRASRAQWWNVLD